MLCNVMLFKIYLKYYQFDIHQLFNKFIWYKIHVLYIL